MTDDFEARLSAIERVRKLRALADRHPDTEEGRSARQMADKLAKQYGVNERVARAKPKIIPGIFDAFAATVKKHYPGIDDEDYSKYKVKGKDDD